MNLMYIPLLILGLTVSLAAAFTYMEARELKIELKALRARMTEVKRVNELLRRIIKKNAEQ